MYSCWHSFGAYKFKASLVLFCNSFVITPYISRRSENHFFGPLQVILGHFENWVVHFFISLIIFCQGVPVRTISLKAYFNCPKAFDICQESIWTVQTVSEQYLSLLEMFPIFQHMFSHCKNFWIALLPRYHGLELSHLYILFFPFTLDVTNFMNSCIVKKMTKNTLEMMMMQVTILFFF